MAMQASLQYRPQERSLGMVMKEVDEDLAIFLEMRRHEKENSDLNLIQKSNDYHVSLASNLDTSVVLEVDSLSTDIVYEVSASENLLVAEKEQKSDYDWLVSPSGTSPFPSLETGVQEAAAGQTEVSNSFTTEPKAEPENLEDESSSLNDTSRQPSTSARVDSCAPGNKRSSSSVVGQKSTTASRFPTPTRGSAQPVKSKPSRASTPTSRGTAPSSKPMAPLARSSTPSRITARSSTPPARSSIPSTSKSISRSTTPTLKPSTPSCTSSNTTASRRSTSVNKTKPAMAKNPGISRGTSPTVRSRPKNPAEVPSSVSDAPPLKVIVPKRPSSATRGRPIASGMKSTSTDATIAKPRQKSCSPMRRQVNASAYNPAGNVLSRSRGYSNGSDDVNPVLVGTKMVERVVNMRKLAPPKDNQPSNENSTKKSSLSQDNSGFGRSLSKKSLDMAIRHMDIRRSINGNLNAIVKSVPASSVYSIRSASMKARTLSASNSPHATSSSASSEPSANNSSSSAFYSSDVEVNDIGSEKESSSPTSLQNQKSGELLAM